MIGGVGGTEDNFLPFSALLLFIPVVCVLRVVAGSCIVFTYSMLVGLESIYPKWL